MAFSAMKTPRTPLPGYLATGEKL